jgi:hypothetical protein
MLLRLLAVVAVLAGVVQTVAADDKLVQKVYHVADLVIPIPDPDASDRPKSGDAPEGGKTCEADLIELIQTAVAPHTWAGAGGRGTLDYFPLGMTLVASQTADAHEQIADLLQTLRKVQDREVVFEVKFVQLAETTFERVGIDFNQEVNAEKTQVRRERDACQSLALLARCQPQRTLLLTDKQLLQFVEASQADRRTNVMQAPKVTAFDGQRVALRVGETQIFVTDVKETKVKDQVVMLPVQTTEFIGTELGLQGSVTPDGKHVCVHVRGGVSTLDPNIPLVPVTTSVQPASEGGPQGAAIPFTQYIQKPRIERLAVEKTVAIPDGGTALIHCGKMTVTGRSEYGPPILSKIPYVNRLFKNVGVSRETRHLVMLVTARARAGDGEEQAEQGARVGSPIGSPPCRGCLPTTKPSTCYGTCPGTTAGKSCPESVVLNERNFDLVSGHAGQPPCGVTDVVRMAQAGVSDDVIVNQIRTTRACFTLGSAGIIGLVGKGVSDRVIQAM